MADNDRIKEVSQPRRSKHPIQVVAQRTGLRSEVIRAWERRYSAVSPERTTTNRRLYSDQDVERLRLIHKAVKAGRRVGEVAVLPSEELMALVLADQSSQAQMAAIPVETPREEPVTGHFSACTAAVRALEPRDLEIALARAAVELSVPRLLNEVVSPLMIHIGDQWRDGILRPCHEHAASAVLRSFLGGLLQSNQPAEAGPVIVVTTPRGQHHELGALIAAVMAAAGGWHPLYLGADCPNEEIAFAAMAKAATAVALSITYPVDDPRLVATLRQLRRQLAENIPLLVGGAAMSGYQAVLEEIGAQQPRDLKAFGLALDRLRMI